MKLKKMLLGSGVALVAGCASGGPAPTAEAPQAPVDTVVAPATEATPAAPAVVGVIVPRTGSPVLRGYADLVLEGVRLAVAEHESAGGRAVELVVVDDAGDPAAVPARVRELEARGAVGVVGPLLSRSLSVAAFEAPELVFVSPTASAVPAGAARAYSLSVEGTEGARALAELSARLGLGRVAVLHPRGGHYERQAAAFGAAMSAAGGQVVATVPYDSGTTTFMEPFERVRAARPQALYIPASARDVRQIAPQVAYFGLDTLGIQILGGEAWTDAEVLRGVEPRFLEGVVATMPQELEGPESGWRAFVERYEAAYRRTAEGRYPALGYDAARLILASLPAAGAVTGESVAGAVARTRGLRGATGVLSVEGGAVVREPVLVRITNGEPIPVQVGEPRYQPLR